MANKTGVREVKGKIQSTWLNNALRSVGAASADVIKDMMPATTETLKSMTAPAIELATSIRRSRTSNKTVLNALKSNPAVKVGEDFFKNATAELKSGNLYGGASSGESSGNSFDEGMNDISFGDMGDDGDSTPDINIQNNTIETDSGDNASIKAMQKSTEYMVEASKNITNTMVTIGTNSMMQNAAVGKDVISHLSSIDSNIKALIDFSNSNIKQFIDASIAYYQQSGSASTNAQVASGEEETAITPDAIYGNGGFDAGAYSKYVKGNLKDYLTKGNTIGWMVSMLLENPEVFTSDPIGFFMKNGIESIIPQVTKDAMARFDEAFKNFMPTLLERIADMGDAEGSSSAMSTIASIFGVKPARSKTLDFSKIEKGPVPYNGMANHTIVEIIPTYLRESTSYLKEIAQSITGKSGSEMTANANAFDWETGTFKTTKELQFKAYNQIASAVAGEIANTEYGKMMSSMSSKLANEDDRTNYETALQELYVMMSEHEGQLNFKENPEILAKMVSKLNYSEDIRNLIEASTLAAAEMGGNEIGSLALGRQRAKNRKGQMISQVNEAAVKNGVTYLYDKNAYTDASMKMSAPESTSPKPNQTAVNAGLKGSIEGVPNAAVTGTITATGSVANTTNGWLENIYNILDRGIYVETKKNIVTKSKREAAQAASQATVVQTNPEITGVDKEALKERIIAEQQEAKARIDAETQASDDDTMILGVGKKAARGLNLATDLLNGILHGNADAAWDKIMDAVSGGLEKAANYLADNFIAPMKKHLFGEKDEAGYLRGGIMGGVNNASKEAFYGLRRMITGMGYTKADGTIVADATGDELSNTVIGKVKNLVGEIKEGISVRLFGEKDENGEVTKEGIIGKAKGGLKSAADSLIEGMHGWKVALFGQSDDPEDTAKHTWENVKEKAKTLLPTALFASLVGIGGHAALGGVLGSIAGGPVVGAMLGLGGMIASKSDKFKDWLFGPEGEDGRIGGIISKQTQNFFAGNKKFLLGGAALGAIGGMITKGGVLGGLVGGPVAGALTGLASSLILKSDVFNKFLFGDEDTGRLGLVKTVKNMFGKFGTGLKGEGASAGMLGIGAGVGAVTVGALANSGLFGLALGPAGPIGGALLGLGGAILAQKENFKEWLLGSTDENGNKRLGILGKFGNMLTVKVFQPIANDVKEVTRDFKSFLYYDILDKFNLIIKPMGEAVFGTISNITGKAITSVNEFTNYIKDDFLENVVEKAASILEPIRNAASGVGKAIYGVGKAIAKAPIDLLYAVTSPVVSAVNATIKTVVGTTFKAIDNLIVKPVSNLVVKPLFKITEFAFNAISAPFKIFNRAVTSISEKLSDTFEHVGNFVGLLGDKIGEGVHKLLFENAFAKMVGAGVEKAKDFGKQVVETTRLIIAPVTDFMKETITGIKDSVMGTIHEVIGGIFNVINPLTWVRTIRGLFTGEEEEKSGKKGFFATLWDQAGENVGRRRDAENMTDSQRRRANARDRIYGIQHEQWYDEANNVTYRKNRRSKGYVRVDADGTETAITAEEFGKLDKDSMKYSRVGVDGKLQNRRESRKEKRRQANRNLIAKWTGYQRIEDTEENRQLAIAAALAKGKHIKKDFFSIDTELSKEQLANAKTEEERKAIIDGNVQQVETNNILVDIRDTLLSVMGNQDAKERIRLREEARQKQAFILGNKEVTSEDKLKAMVDGAEIGMSLGDKLASGDATDHTMKNASIARRANIRNNIGKFGLFKGLGVSLKAIGSEIKGSVNAYNDSVSRSSTRSGRESRPRRTRDNSTESAEAAPEPDTTINTDELPHHAGGTPSAQPGFAVVGEEGPELVRFRGGEEVTPTGDTNDIFNSLSRQLGYIGLDVKSISEQTRGSNALLAEKLDTLIDLADEEPVTAGGILSEMLTDPERLESALQHPLATAIANVLGYAVPRVTKSINDKVMPWIKSKLHRAPITPDGGIELSPEDTSGFFPDTTGLGVGIDDIPHHAEGTDSAKPGLALVGEEGPEIVMMKGGEKVIPNDSLGTIFTGALKDIRDILLTPFTAVAQVTHDAINSVKEQAVQFKDHMIEFLKHNPITDWIRDKKNQLTETVKELTAPLTQLKEEIRNVIVEDMKKAIMAPFRLMAAPFKLVGSGIGKVTSALGIETPNIFGKFKEAWDNADPTKKAAKVQATPVVAALTENTDKSIDAIASVEDKVTTVIDAINNVNATLKTTNPGTESAVTSTDMGELASSIKETVNTSIMPIGGGDTIADQEAQAKVSNLTAVAQKAKIAEMTEINTDNARDESRNALLTEIRDGLTEHHSTWDSIFSKKGLITAGLIAAAPLIFKVIKGIWALIKKFLGGDGSGGDGLITTVLDTAARVNEDAEFNKEMGGLGDGKTPKQKVEDELNGLKNVWQHIKDGDIFGALANFLFDERGNVTNETGARGKLLATTLSRAITGPIGFINTIKNEGFGKAIASLFTKKGRANIAASGVESTIDFGTTSIKDGLKGLFGKGEIPAEIPKTAVVQPNVFTEANKLAEIERMMNGGYSYTNTYGSVLNSELKKAGSLRPDLTPSLNPNMTTIADETWIRNAEKLAKNEVDMVDDAIDRYILGQSKLGNLSKQQIINNAEAFAANESAKFEATVLEHIKGIDPKAGSTVGSRLATNYDDLLKIQSNALKPNYAPEIVNSVTSKNARNIMLENAEKLAKKEAEAFDKELARIAGQSMAKDAVKPVTTETLSTIAKSAAGGIDDAAELALLAKVGGAETVGKAVGSAATKDLGKAALAASDITPHVSRFGEKLVASVEARLGKKVGTGVLSKAVGAITKWLGSPSNFKRVAGRIANILKITAGAAATGVGILASNAVTITLGACNGLSGAKRLFRTDAEPDLLMLGISGGFGALGGWWPIGAIMDVIIEVITTVTGIDWYYEIATAIYELVAGKEKYDALRETQKDFQAKYAGDTLESLTTQYQTLTKTGMIDGSKIKLEDYVKKARAGEMAGHIQSFADYNDEQHKTLGARIWDDFGDPIMESVFGRQVHRYDDAKTGAYYKENRDGTYEAYDKDGNDLGFVHEDYLAKNKNFIKSRGFSENTSAFGENWQIGKDMITDWWQNDKSVNAAKPYMKAAGDSLIDASIIGMSRDIFGDIGNFIKYAKGDINKDEMLANSSANKRKARDDKFKETVMEDISAITDNIKESFASAKKSVSDTLSGWKDKFYSTDAGKAWKQTFEEDLPYVVSKSWSLLKDEVSEKITEVKDGFGVIGDTIKTKFTKDMNDMREGLAYGAEIAKEKINNAKTAISTSLSIIGTIWSNMVEDIKAKFAPAVTIVRTVIENTVEKAKNSINAAKAILSSFFETYITKPVRKMSTTVKTAISTGINTVGTIVKNKFEENIAKPIRTIIDSIKETVSNVAGTIGDKIKELLDKINIFSGKNWINNLADSYRKSDEIAENNKKLGIGGKGVGVNAYALGTNNASRGVALVGENGPEIVMMRGGEKVIPADDTRRILGGRGPSDGYTLSASISTLNEIINSDWKGFGNHLVSLWHDNVTPKIEDTKELITTNYTSISDQFTTLWDTKLGPATDTLRNAISSGFTTFGNSISNLWTGNLRNKVTSFTDGFMKSFSSFGDSLTKVKTNIAQKLTTVLSAFNIKLKTTTGGSGIGGGRGIGSAISLAISDAAGQKISNPAFKSGTTGDSIAQSGIIETLASKSGVEFEKYDNPSAALISASAKNSDPTIIMGKRATTGTSPYSDAGDIIATTEKNNRTGAITIAGDGKRRKFTADDIANGAKTMWKFKRHEVKEPDEPSIFKRIRNTAGGRGVFGKRQRPMGGRGYVEGLPTKMDPNAKDKARYLGLANSYMGSKGSHFFSVWGMSCDWCAMFVATCAKEAGLGDKFPWSASCNMQIKWWKEQGRWVGKTNDVQAGDIIYFDWQEPNPQTDPDYYKGMPVDHVGIVAKVTDTSVITIEGNTGGGGYNSSVVSSNTYNKSYVKIVGYARPAYNDSTWNGTGITATTGSLSASDSSVGSSILDVFSGNLSKLASAAFDAAITGNLDIDWENKFDKYQNKTFKSGLGTTSADSTDDKKEDSKDTSSTDKKETSTTDKKTSTGTSTTTQVAGPAKPEGASGIGKLFNRGGGRGSYFSQNDPAWKDVPLIRSDGSDDGSTMGNSGCGPAALAMAISDTIGSTVNPLSLAKYSHDAGYSDETGTNWGFMSDAPSQFGIATEQIIEPNRSDITDALSMGTPVILSGVSDDESTYTSAGHYVVADGMDSNGMINIKDPRGKSYNKRISASALENDTTSVWKMIPGARGSFKKIGRRIFDKLSGFGGRGSGEMWSALSKAAGKIRNTSAYPNTPLGLVRLALSILGFPKSYTEATSINTIWNKGVSEGCFSRMVRDPVNGNAPWNKTISGGINLQRGDIVIWSGDWYVFCNYLSNGGAFCKLSAAVDSGALNGQTITYSNKKGTITVYRHIKTPAAITISKSDSSSSSSDDDYGFDSGLSVDASIDDTPLLSLDSTDSLTASDVLGGGLLSGLVDDNSVYGKLVNKYGKFSNAAYEAMITGNSDIDWDAVYADEEMTIDGDFLDAGGSGGTQITGTDDQDKVWRVLVTPRSGGGEGFSKAGAAAIMANMQRESGFNPKIAGGEGWDKSKGKPGDRYKQLKSGAISKAYFKGTPYYGGLYQEGFGLCQWLGEGKQYLYDYTEGNGKDIGEIKNQADYLRYSLYDGRYKSYYDRLRTALEGDNAKQAMDFFLRRYELGIANPYEGTITNGPSASQYPWCYSKSSGFLTNIVNKYRDAKIPSSLTDGSSMSSYAAKDAKEEETKEKTEGGSGIGPRIMGYNPAPHEVKNIKGGRGSFTGTFIPKKRYANSNSIGNDLTKTNLKPVDATIRTTRFNTNGGYGSGNTIDTSKIEAMMTEVVIALKSISSDSKNLSMLKDIKSGMSGNINTVNNTVVNNTGGRGSAPSVSKQTKTSSSRIPTSGSSTSMSNNEKLARRIAFGV